MNPRRDDRGASLECAGQAALWPVAAWRHVVAKDSRLNFIASINNGGCAKAAAGQSADKAAHCYVDVKG